MLSCPTQTHKSHVFLCPPLPAHTDYGYLLAGILSTYCDALFKQQPEGHFQCRRARSLQKPPTLRNNLNFLRPLPAQNANPLSGWLPTALAELSPCHASAKPYLLGRRLSLCRLSASSVPNPPFSARSDGGAAEGAGGTPRTQGSPSVPSSSQQPLCCPRVLTAPSPRRASCKYVLLESSAQALQSGCFLDPPGLDSLEFLPQVWEADLCY